jgi:hypothetical protein
MGSNTKYVNVLSVVVVVVAHEERRTGSEREKERQGIVTPYKWVHSIIGASARATVGHTSQRTLLFFPRRLNADRRVYSRNDTSSDPGPTFY